MVRSFCQPSGTREETSCYKPKFSVFKKTHCADSVRMVPSVHNNTFLYEKKETNHEQIKSDVFDDGHDVCSYSGARGCERRLLLFRRLLCFLLRVLEIKAN